MIQDEFQEPEKLCVATSNLEILSILPPQLILAEWLTENKCLKVNHHLGSSIGLK
jgi:hypothetical protein